MAQDRVWSSTKRVIFDLAGVALSIDSRIDCAALPPLHLHESDKSLNALFSVCMEGTACRVFTSVYNTVGGRKGHGNELSFSEYTILPSLTCVLVFQSTARSYLARTRPVGYRSFFLWSLSYLSYWLHLK